MPDSMRPAMVVAPQLLHAAAAAGHDAAPRLTPRGASTASFQHFKAISRSDRCACARANAFASSYACTVLASPRTTTGALSQNPLTDHLAASPVLKPRSKISRVVRTERPAPVHTCWVSSLEPDFCLSRRTPPLGRLCVQSCGNFSLAGGGVPSKVLYGGDVDAFVTSSTP